MSKNTAVFGIYRNRLHVEQGVDALIDHGFRSEDISVLLPDNVGTKDFAHEKNTKAPQAAGKIHSDIERGFIRAEICTYDNFVKYKSRDALRTAGLLRSEGKDYVMQEGDIVEFRFNV